MGNRSTVAALAALWASFVLGACGGKTAEYYRDAGSAPSSGDGPAVPAPTWDPGETDDPPAAAEPPPLPTRDPSACATTFRKDVMPVLVKYSCSSLSCHGGANPPNLPKIEPTDPVGTYGSITSFVMSDGRRYVRPMDVCCAVDPKEHGIHCNVRGRCGVPMPLGGSMSDVDLAWIDAWLTCGAPLE